MLACLQHCQSVKGLLLVAPQHRMSLLLKTWEQVKGKGPSASTLMKIHELPYFDILDESDELLNHRYQLVYACGDAMAKGVAKPLPSLHERATALQCLLQAVSKAGDRGGIWADRSIVHFMSHDDVTRRPGAYSGHRLLPGKALDDALHGGLQSGHLLRELAEILMEDPPEDLRWLKDHPLKSDILTYALDESLSEEYLDSLPVPYPLKISEKDQILALRGFLAHGILTHGLLMRHEVDYGIHRSKGKKRLSVPFRAAQTPDPKSEFAQPDVSLLLTHLSYYKDGLSPDQMLEAVTALLKLGPNAQEDIFNGWISLAQETGQLNAVDAMVDGVKKLDTTNVQQREVLLRCFSHNMAAINFWLLSCRVLAVETKQFPGKITANSWHIADNASQRVVGFSGTNDHHRLLPSQVHQADLKEELELAGTNGRMLHYLISLTNGIHSTTPMWTSLLDLALELRVGALLDCGAFLANVSTKDAAKYLITRMQEVEDERQAVCYYDIEVRKWMVMEAKGRCLPRGLSPIQESSAFVIYDDTR